MEENNEVEKLDMSKKPKEEIAVFGLGVVLNHLKEMVKIQRDVLSTVRFLENKVEALLDEKAQERLERIKRRF